MNSFFATHRTLVFIALGIGLAVIGWMFLAPEPESDDLLASETTAGETAIERSIVDSLLTLRAVTLTSTIFTEPAFASLRDFGTEIVAEPIGRQNPFAPLSQRGGGGTGGRVFDR